MMRRTLFATVALIAVVAFGTISPFDVSTRAAANVEVGASVADFKLPDASGVNHSLASLKGAKGTALIFVSVQCPVSNAYNERMAKLASEYKAKGINVVGINSNKSEDAGAIRQHAQENNLSFVILKDANNKIADQLGAQVTPEVFLLDASNKLVYRGRIDDSRSGTNITANDTRDAMEALINNQSVKTTQAKAFGCTIKRV